MGFQQLLLNLGLNFTLSPTPCTDSREGAAPTKPSEEKLLPGRKSPGNEWSVQEVTIPRAQVTSEGLQELTAKHGEGQGRGWSSPQRQGKAATHGHGTEAPGTQRG